MRDKNRIKPFLQKLEDLWLQYPDLRFGQLLHIVALNSGWMNKDLFYIEDNIIAEQIEKELK